MTDPLKQLRECIQCVVVRSESGVRVSPDALSDALDLIASLLSTREGGEVRGDLRCAVTTNPCGTDTWAAGHPCQCASCKLRLGIFMAGRDDGLRQAAQPTADRAIASAGDAPDVVQAAAINAEREGLPPWKVVPPLADVRVQLETLAGNHTTLAALSLVLTRERNEERKRADEAESALAALRAGLCAAFVVDETTDTVLLEIARTRHHDTLEGARQKLLREADALECEQLRATVATREAELRELRARERTLIDCAHAASDALAHVGAAAGGNVERARAALEPVRLWSYPVTPPPAPARTYLELAEAVDQTLRALSPTAEPGKGGGEHG